MPVGGDGPQHGLAAAFRGVEIDAVQIIACLLGGDGEAGLLDEALQLRRRHGEGVAEIVDAQARKVVGGQRLQREARLTATDGEPSLVALPRNLDIGALRELAHDVVEHVGGHRGGAIASGARRHRLDDLHVEVGRGQLQLVIARGEMHVGQDGNGVAPLDHARHMGERLGQSRLIDGELHGLIETTPAPPRGGCRHSGRSRQGPGARTPKRRDES